MHPDSVDNPCMKLIPSAILLALCLLLTGCGGKSGPSLDTFKEKWYAAINQRQAENLYPLLDSKSRRTIDQALETLRGLNEQEQLTVINHLGGERIRTLQELSSDRYFALWWRRTTDDQLPTMTFEAVGEQSAYMIVALGENTQRFALKVEGGRWVWSLPEQRFEMAQTTKTRG